MILNNSDSIINLIKNFSITHKESKEILEFRLMAFDKFIECQNPSFGPDLKLDYNNLNYFVDEDNIEIKKIVTDEFIICDIHTAFKEYKKIIDKYYAKLLLNEDDKFSLLNSSVWNNGMFIYIYPNKKVNIPAEVINFSKNIIIIDENAELNYIDINNNINLLVLKENRIIIKNNSKCRYINIQNSSSKTVNLSIKTFDVEENGNLDFINISLGSKITMDYPTINLNGKNSSVNINSILIANRKRILDEGIKINSFCMNTSSSLLISNYSLNGGESNYRGYFNISKEAINSKCSVICESNILDSVSKGDIVSKNIIENNSSSFVYDSKFNNKLNIKFNEKRYIKYFLEQLNLERNLIRYLTELLK